MPQCRRSLRVGMSVVVGAGLLAGLMLGGGCSRASKYRSNPSPEVDTLSQTRDEIDNRLTVTNDSNLRQFNRDVGYFFMLERPSRLTPHPVGY